MTTGSCMKLGKVRIELTGCAVVRLATITNPRTLRSSEATETNHEAGQLNGTGLILEGRAPAWFDEPVSHSVWLRERSFGIYES